MSASDKAVIVKFLKDNDVTAEPDEAKVQALRDEFQDELAVKREARRQYMESRLVPRISSRFMVLPHSSCRPATLLAGVTIKKII